MEVNYEWTLEEINNDGDIVNSDFSENVQDFIPEYLNDIKGYHLGLVMNEGNEFEGVTDRFWAYVKDGKLPELFSDATGNEISIRVPKRFHLELAKYIK